MDGLIILLPIALLALIFFSGRKRQREAATVQSQLSPGAEIVTTAGLYATVVEVEADSVVLESSPGVQSRWARAAVARITSSAEDVAAADAEDAAGPADPSAPAATAASATTDDVIVVDPDDYAVPDDLSELDHDQQDRGRDEKGRDPRGGGSQRGGIDDPGGRRP